jgi:hypothetical protein
MMMHDIVPLAEEMKGDAMLLHLGVDRWSSFATKAPLAWVSVPWDKAQRPAVPTERGIYAFTVQFANSLLPCHGYILYVGITGDKKSTQTLRDRFASYFTTKEKERGRTRVGYLLNKWDGHLTFQYAEVPDHRFNLHKLEKQLCDSIIPYATRNDLSAKIRKAKEAAGL